MRQFERDMKMNMTKKMMVAAVGMAAALAASAMTEAIAYRGVIRSAEGEGRIRVLSMTFTVYDSAAPDKPLWARYVSVKIAADGSFGVELKDSLGTNPLGLVTPLASAVASMKGEVEIGLKPPEAAEFKPRQTLATCLSAERAAVAKKVATVTVSNGVVRANRALAFDSMIVNGDFYFGGFAPRSTAQTVRVDKFGSEAIVRSSDEKGALTVVGGVSGIGEEVDTKGGYPASAFDDSRDRVVTVGRVWGSRRSATTEFFAAGEKGPDTNELDRVSMVRVQTF